MTPWGGPGGHQWHPEGQPIGTNPKNNLSEKTDFLKNRTDGHQEPKQKKRRSPEGAMATSECSPMGIIKKILGPLGGRGVLLNNKTTLIFQHAPGPRARRIVSKF